MKTYAVVDIETRIDKTLVNATKYPGLGLSDDEAYERFKATLLAKNGTDFLPVGFHVPISISIAHVDEQYHLISVETLAQSVNVQEVLGSHGPDIEQAMVHDFWQLVNEGHTLVTYSGRGFDLPVLELAALRYGIQAPRYWNEKFGHRYRYSTDNHYDVADVLCNTGATRQSSLNSLLIMLGFGSKGDVDGSKVQGMWEEGKLAEIHAYCRRDVVSTWALWTRLELIRGRLTRAQYESVCAAAEPWLQEIR